MHVTLIGFGCAGEQLTGEAKRALEEADQILGAGRMLALLPPHSAKTAAAYLPEEVCALLRSEEPEHACVVFGGDSGFYSGAAALLKSLKENGIPAEVLPGISSLQLLSARLGRPWQSWQLCSAHGRVCEVRKEIMAGKPCFFLTGGEESPQTLCQSLSEAGLGELKVTVGEALGYPDERIVSGTAAELAKEKFAPLSVLLTEAAPIWEDRAPGIPDECFLRTKVPMTKREVRTAILSALRVSSEDLCWDLGAGTGSVGIELALHSRGVWAVEKDPEAVGLIEENRKRFGAWNLRIVPGEAPGVFGTLPKPDAVFVGGSGGHLEEILRQVREIAPKARICVSAIALETLAKAVEILEAAGDSVSVTQLAVSRTKPIGQLHLLAALNPIFLITGQAE